jgi:hypothetical protein
MLTGLDLFDQRTHLILALRHDPTSGASLTTLHIGSVPYGYTQPIET